MNSSLSEQLAGDADWIFECAKLRNELTRKKEMIWQLRDQIRQLEADNQELRITRAGLQAMLDGLKAFA